MMKKPSYILGLSVGILSLSLMGCQQNATTTTAPQTQTPTTTATQAVQTTQETQTQSNTQANSSELKINGLTFTFPTGWTLQKIETQSNKVSTWEIAKIKVPDAKYNVVIPF